MRAIMRLFTESKIMAGYICWDDTGWIGRVRPLLRGSGVVVSPTDTVPGLLALATPAGAMALDQVKDRSRGKPYLVLVGSRQQAYELMDEQKVAKNPAIKTLMERCWPGPLTLIVPAHPSVPSSITLNGFIAIRMPDHAQLRELALAVGPLFSTSANKEGEPTPRCMDEVDEALRVQATAVISGAMQLGCNARPSTILECTGEVIRLVRAGAYSLDQLVDIVPIST